MWLRRHRAVQYLIRTSTGRPYRTGRAALGNAPAPQISNSNGLLQRLRAALPCILERVLAREHLENFIVRWSCAFRPFYVSRAATEQLDQFSGSGADLSVDLDGNKRAKGFFMELWLVKLDRYQK